MAEYEEDLSPAQRLDVLWAMCELRVNLVDDIRDRVDAAATDGPRSHADPRRGVHIMSKL